MNKKIRVLIASENSKAGKKIASFLKSWDNEIDSTEPFTFAGALDAVTHNVYDCVVIAEGEEADGGKGTLNNLEAIKNRNQAIPLILAAPQEDALFAMRCIKAGVYDYIPLGALDMPDKARILHDSIMNSVSRFERKAEKRKQQTAIKLSEERYRGLIEHSPIFIMRFFADDNIINFVNDGFCRYFNLERSQIVGEDISFFLSRNAREKLTERVAALSEKNPVVSFEMGTRSGDRVLWQQWTVQGIFDSTGKAIEYQCMGEDITGLKTTNQKLNKTLDRVRDLKNMQDGDYFLTSLILDPLGQNRAVSDVVTVDFFVKEYKEFVFKKWNSSIGGDICYSHNIYLNEKIYIVFLNADAMGKSMQGAGGALVLGAVFQSIIDRSRFSSDEQEMYPEKWLKRSFQELQRIFEVFNGSMLISLIMGLVEEDTGLMFFINAEHPWTVLYRKGRASFIEKGMTQRKIGTQGANLIVSVQTFQLEQEDVIIAGSDGRDEIVLKDDHGNETEINQDENLFLETVERCGADLKAIYDRISETGEVRDDVSFLMLTFGKLLSETDTQKAVLEIMKEYSSISDDKKNQEGMVILEDGLKRFGQHPLMLRPLKEMYYESIDYENAWKTGKKLLQLDSSNIEEIYVTSFSAMQAGDLRDAEKLAERIYIRKPDDLKFLAHYARLLLANEKYSEAYTIINEILAIDPADINALTFQQELDNKMAIIKWNDRYLVNIDEIDRQHRELVETINTLKKSLSKNEDSATIKSILARMNTYALEHFDLEERYMLETNFPLYGEHKREHEYFKREITKFQKYFYAGRAELTAHMLTFLSSWFKGHLLGTDRKYIRHFTESGLK